MGGGKKQPLTHAAPAAWNCRDVEMWCVRTMKRIYRISDNYSEYPIAKNIGFIGVFEPIIQILFLKVNI